MRNIVSCDLIGTTVGIGVATAQCSANCLYFDFLIPEEMRIASFTTPIYIKNVLQNSTIQTTEYTNLETNEIEIEIPSSIYLASGTFTLSLCTTGYISDDISVIVSSSLVSTNDIIVKDTTTIATQPILNVRKVIEAPAGNQNYNDLNNKPSINGNNLIGDKTSSQLGLQDAGDYVEDTNYVHTDSNYTNVEKQKLSGIEEGANNYVLPSDVVQDSSYVHTENSYTTVEKQKLAGIEEGANNYVLPSGVVQDNSYVHTDSNYTTVEKQKLSGIEDGANNYVLPSDVVQDSSYVHTENSYTTIEKQKLSGIEEGANNYVLPIASTTELGGIKVGDGLEIDSNGVLRSLGGGGTILHYVAINGVTLKSGNTTITRPSIIPEPYNIVGIQFYRGGSICNAFWAGFNSSNIYIYSMSAYTGVTMNVIFTISAIPEA